MDTCEYTLVEQKLSAEDEQRIQEYNSKYTRIALEMLKYNRDKLVNDKEYAALSEDKRVQHIYTHDDFKEFCMTYPMVSRFIVAFGLFSTKAFVKYLDWKAKVRPTDEMRAKLMGKQREQEKFKNKYIYAVYVKYLHMYKINKHANLDLINAAYNEAVEMLNRDTDEFFDAYEEVDRVNKKREAESVDERKRMLVEQLQNKLNSTQN